jgi:hypothetical protein
MAGVGAPWPVMGELAGEGREGERRALLLGGARGGGQAVEGRHSGCCSVRAAHVGLLYVRRKQEDGEEKREKKRREGKKGKMGFFQT